jgi:hypothetical protein
MNLHQMKKCQEWVNKYCPSTNQIYPKAYVTEKLYEFIMPYRRNVQNLKKDKRYLKGEIERLRLSNQGDGIK